MGIKWKTTRCIRDHRLPTERTDKGRDITSCRLVQGHVIDQVGTEMESLYRHCLPQTSLQPLTVLQEILDDFFTSNLCSTGIPSLHYQSYVVQ